MRGRPLLLSIVVPVLNEEATVGLLLSDLARLNAPHEVVVVDGGSTDRSVEVSRAAGARVVRSGPGRGARLRTGVEVARSPLLLFLHADARLDDGALELLDETAVACPPCAMVFRLGIDAPGPLYRLIEWGADLRTRAFRLPYGDQGLLVRRDTYVRAGGHPPVPLIEDVALARALQEVTKLHVLDAAVRVSARRWRADRPLRRTLKDWLLLIRYLAGTPPERLPQAYEPEGAAHG